MTHDARDAAPLHDVRNVFRYIFDTAEDRIDGGAMLGDVVAVRSEIGGQRASRWYRDDAA